MDALFKGRQVSDAEIIDAKKAYRKLYQKHYYKSYSNNNIQISFRISKEEFRLLNNMSVKSGMKMTVFIRQLLTRPTPPCNIELKLLCLETIDNIELSLYKGENMEMYTLLESLRQMLKLLG